MAVRHANRNHHAKGCLHELRQNHHVTVQSPHEEMARSLRAAGLSERGYRFRRGRRAEEEEEVVEEVEDPEVAARRKAEEERAAALQKEKEELEAFFNFPEVE